MSKDMTKAQFDKKAREFGFKPEGFMGYYALPVEPAVCVSVLNAGDSRRARLAYLLKELARHNAMIEKAGS